MNTLLCVYKTSYLALFWRFPDSFFFFPSVTVMSQHPFGLSSFPILSENSLKWFPQSVSQRGTQHREATGRRGASIAVGLQAEMRDGAAVGEGQGDHPGAEGDSASQQESVPQLFSKKGGFAETGIVSYHFSLGLVFELTVGQSVLPKCHTLRALGAGQNPLSSHSTRAFLISCLASGLCLPVFSILTAQESTAQMQMDNRRLAPARGKWAHSLRRPLLKDAFLAPPATYTSLAQQISNSVSKSSPSGLPVGSMDSDCHIFRRFKFTTKSSALPLKHNQCLRHG